MDADACYLQMYQAMRDGDLAGARKQALALKEWLDNGGACPLFYAEEEVRGYLASVLRRTCAFDEAPPREESHESPA